MDYYLSLDKPYLTADTAMASSSELRLLKGMSEKNYPLLAKQISTLKTQGTPININVNTASSEVLVALGLNDALATDIIEQRDDQAFQTLDQFLQYADVATLLKDKTDGLAVNTQWFLLQAEIQIDRSRIALNSILFRDNNGITRVVQRNYGS
jgi:general secretion pathway protein K